MVDEKPPKPPSDETKDKENAKNGNEPKITIGVTETPIQIKWTRRSEPVVAFWAGKKQDGRSNKAYCEIKLAMEDLDMDGHRYSVVCLLEQDNFTASDPEQGNRVITQAWVNRAPVAGHFKTEAAADKFAEKMLASVNDWLTFDDNDTVRLSNEAVRETEE